MNQFIRLTQFSVFGLLLASCAPNAKQLKETIQSDPSIVFAAIEKAPDQFIEIVMKAQQNAQKVAGERAQQDEQKQREEEFKNPLKPVIEESRVIFGNKSAPITIVEYSDFQCPYCSRGYQTMIELKKEYGDKVRVVFKHLPLDFHPLAVPAARYFEAIAMQDHLKAEKFHNLVFENQAQMQSKGENLFKELAKKVGADMKKVEASLKEEKISQRIAADSEEAKKFNFSGTPGYLVNGISLKGAYPLAAFKEIIDRQLASKN
jgi:protein-disulfide isomerase